MELMTADGIVELVDPGAEAIDDTTYSSIAIYDSIIANLPNYNIDASISLADKAVLSVVIDPRSGDYIQVRGNSDLNMKYDRTGNLQLNGSYAIKEGYYQLSFYDIVKKKFFFAPNSKISWSGLPMDGILDITALHTVKTSSLGLMGNEIGENEKSLYRKALPYEVRIIIRGTIEEPEISFGLDLPAQDKVNYPALNSKLDRLKQPEYESELNKQVFGLLVLGGFIPEASGSDFNESAVATTALANSVNGLLTAQLNRLTNQIEGVDINIGLQSYSDYQTGSGSPRTAMDFRVTKRFMEDRLSIEVGGEMDIDAYNSGANRGQNTFRGDVAIVYNLTESGNKKLKAFNNETYDIIYHQVRNTGIALIFIREFDKGERRKKEEDR